MCFLVETWRRTLMGLTEACGVFVHVSASDFLPYLKEGSCWAGAGEAYAVPFPSSADPKDGRAAVDAGVHHSSVSWSFESSLPPLLAIALAYMSQGELWAGIG